LPAHFRALGETNFPLPDGVMVAQQILTLLV
jgi:hypothetical protein